MTAAVIGVAVCRRELDGKRLPGALVRVRVAEHTFEVETHSDEDARAIARDAQRVLADAVVERVHVIRRGEKIAAVFAGTRGEEAARELALLAQGGSAYDISTHDVERQSSEITLAPPERVETQDQILARMRVQVGALVDGWLLRLDVPGEVEAAQALAGFALSRLRTAGVPLEDVIAQIAPLWDVQVAS